MTAVSNNDIARAIFSLLRDKSHSEQSIVFSKVVKFLFKKRLLSKTPEILLHLKKIINQEEGRVVAKISSVKALDHKAKVSLEFFLKKHYSAREIILMQSLDPKLLGGLKIEIDNEIIDLSIKNRIGKLQEHLIKSA